jgi:hypothetical protein
MEETLRTTASRSHRYALAGWLAIVSAILVVPEIGLGTLLGLVSPAMSALITPLRIINLAIGIFVLYMFRKLLNERYDFHQTDSVIMILIYTNVFFFFLGMGEVLFDIIGADTTALSLISICAFIPFGIVTVVFGVLLLRLKDDLYGLLKPFAYTTIASGALGATIILAVFGLLAALVALVIQGMVFLRAKEQEEIL